MHSTLSRTAIRLAGVDGLQVRARGVYVWRDCVRRAQRARRSLCLETRSPGRRVCRLRCRLIRHTTQRR
jgi:hypothetical protein